MTEKPTRQVHRNWDEAERLRHGQQVQERFVREREDRFRKVQDVVEVMLAQGVTISQNEVARVAGVSVGFINKHLRDVVEKAKQRQQKSAGTLHTVRQLSAETKELERLKLMNRRLREQLDEQRRANKELLAQVARVVDLEDDVDLLRKQNRELLTSWQASQEKVIDLPVQNKLPIQNTSTQVEVALKQTGIKISPKLNKEIRQHSSENVFKAIEAFEQYRSENIVQKPAACLLRAIKEEWEPNIAQKPTKSEEREFDEWYAEAIRQGFVLDLPKNYLGVSMIEIEVKVKDAKAPSGYINMRWREAKTLMKESRENIYTQQI